MSRAPFRAIPSPGDTLDTMRASVDALKENFEILQGLRGSRGTSAQVFLVDPVRAEDIPVGVNNGDLWVQTNPLRFSVWRDDKWVT